MSETESSETLAAPDNTKQGRALAEPLPVRTIATLGLATFSCGFATGLLAGLTGPDATVVTAIVSALLAGIGITAVAVSYLRVAHGTATQGGLLAIILAIAIIVGVDTGISNYFDDQIGLDLGTAARQHHLLRICSDQQAAINEERRMLELEPLPTGAFCPLIFPTAQLERH